MRFPLLPRACAFACALLGASAPLFADPAEKVPEPHFLTATRVFRTGAAEVVPFAVAHAPKEKTVYPLRVEGPDGTLAVLLPPTVLPGRTVGFLRIDPRQAGQAALLLDKSRLEARVVPGGLDPARPQVVSPTAGCDAWGPVTVCAELFSARPGDDPRTVSLRLPDGRELPGLAAPPQPGECFRRFTFRVDADALPPGVALLTPVLRDGQAAVEGDPLWLNIVRPKPGQLLSGSCAARNADPRALQAGEKPPDVQKDPEADGGQRLGAFNNKLGWCLAVDVPTPGYYQLILRAKGTEGGGALPTIGLRFNEDRTPVASSRLSPGDWHRVPIGTPFRLPPGAHILTVAYMNDFRVGPDKRDLFLDRYELLRLDANAAAPPSPGMAMMAGEEPP